MKKNTSTRPPIVTLMGHVDHGKTSLLDAIRKSKLVNSEFGEITQHIGAYTVEVNKHPVTFLDTPGHEAFAAMRARGAKVTDIVVLVVSVEDGLMPQTVEAVNHCRAAGVPIIVALNKVDRGRKNIPLIKAKLAEHEIVSEELGGQVLFVETSALKGTGVKQLLEAITLQAEMMELKTDCAVPAEGVVIESKLERGTGTNLTLVLMKGTLEPRQAFVVGSTWGKVRRITDDEGKTLRKLTPGLAGRVIGVNGIPQPGAEFRVVLSEKDARAAVTQNQTQRVTDVPKGITLEEFYQKLKADDVNDLNVILRADVPGSLEALMESMDKIGSAEAQLKYVLTGVGNVTESDIMLARAADSIILGFNVGIEPAARNLAEREKVQVRRYRIIYELLEDVRKALSGLLAPEITEVITGEAVVKEVFVLSDGQVIAGCGVTSGKMTRNSKARLLREGKIEAESFITSLRRFKENVREVAAGYDCGIGLQNVKEMSAGDTISSYAIKEVSRTL